MRAARLALTCGCSERLAMQSRLSADVEHWMKTWNLVSDIAHISGARRAEHGLIRH